MNTIEFLNRNGLHKYSLTNHKGEKEKFESILNRFSQPVYDEMKKLNDELKELRDQLEGSNSIMGEFNIKIEIEKRLFALDRYSNIMSNGNR